MFKWWRISTRLWKSLCTLYAPQRTFIMATVTSCLTTFALACIQNCLVTSQNKHWEIVCVKKKKGPQKMQTSCLWNGQQQQKRTKWTLLLRDTKKLVGVAGYYFHSAFHAGLSQNNNLCNILSQSVRSNSLMATSI